MMSVREELVKILEESILDDLETIKNNLENSSFILETDLDDYDVNINDECGSEEVTWDISFNVVKNKDTFNIYLEGTAWKNCSYGRWVTTENFSLKNYDVY